MKILKESEKEQKIILEDNDILKIETMKGNPIQIIIECNDGIISIDEINLYKIKDLKIEKEQLKKLEKYIKEES